MGPWHPRPLAAPRPLLPLSSTEAASKGPDSAALALPGLAGAQGSEAPRYRGPSSALAPRYLSTAGGVLRPQAQPRAAKGPIPEVPRSRPQAEQSSKQVVTKPVRCLTTHPPPGPQKRRRMPPPNHLSPRGGPRPMCRPSARHRNTQAGVRPRLGHAEWQPPTTHQAVSTAGPRKLGSVHAGAHGRGVSTQESTAGDCPCSLSPQPQWVTKVPWPTSTAVPGSTVPAGIMSTQQPHAAMDGARQTQRPLQPRP